MICRTIALPLAFVAVSACGGVTTGPATVDILPASFASAAVFSDYRGDGDERMVLRTFPNTDISGTITMTPTSAALPAGARFAAFASDDGPGARFRMFEANSDNAYAVVTGFVNDNIDNLSYVPQSNIFTFGGTVPNSGSATYTGEYAGFLSQDAVAGDARNTSHYILGDVALTTDFASGQTSGSITDRTLIRTSNDNPGGTLQDVTLSLLTMSGGQSSATGAVTLGGRINSGITEPANGTQLNGRWTAALAGPTGAEAVGTVAIAHDYLQGPGFISDDFVENGVFAAGRN